MKIIKSVTPVLAGARLFIWAVTQEDHANNPPSATKKIPGTKAPGIFVFRPKPVSEAECRKQKSLNAAVAGACFCRNYCLTMVKSSDRILIETKEPVAIQSCQLLANPKFLTLDDYILFASSETV